MKHPEFAERFRQAVSQSNIDNTQKHLAKLLGVSEVMIWSYRNGEKLPRMTTALRMANVFGVSVEWLLQGKAYQVQETPASYTANMTVEKIIALVSQLPSEKQQQALSLLEEHFS